jgi:hypothetical protein
MVYSSHSKASGLQNASVLPVMWFCVCAGVGGREVETLVVMATLVTLAEVRNQYESKD